MGSMSCRIFQRWRYARSTLKVSFRRVKLEHQRSALENRLHFILSVVFLSFKGMLASEWPLPNVVEKLFCISSPS